MSRTLGLPINDLQAEDQIACNAIAAPPSLGVAAFFPRKKKSVFHWLNSRSYASGWRSHETMRLRIHGRRSALLALCPLASSVAAALFSDATRQLLRSGNANAIHGCKPHLVSNLMVTMTSERIIEQVNERVGVRKRPPLRE